MSDKLLVLSNMQQHCKLYGMVEVDQLRSTWKARKFPIDVPVLLVQSGLLPSIFDWQLLGQLMPMDQAMGEAMLQQRINDLELLNSLTTSLQRIEILPESGIDVDVVIGRPSYNVKVQDNGRILVEELPSLHIHIYAVESPAAAGQERKFLNNDNVNNNEDTDDIVEDDRADTVMIDQLASGHDTTGQPTDNNDRNKKKDKSMQLTKLKSKDSQETFDFFYSLEESGNLTEKYDEPTDFLTESEEQADIKLRRRMSFWMRFGNWLRQSVPRFN